MSEKITIIDQVEFPISIGVKILKQKGKQTIESKGLDTFKDVEDLTFMDALSLRNIEQRRVAIKYLGINEIVSKLGGELISRETLHKTTMYVNPEGKLVNREFDDTYELYRLDRDAIWAGSVMDRRRRVASVSDIYFVKCWCTSTQREYLIWVDINGVKTTNGIRFSQDDNVNAIQAIAWTIQTNIPKGKIEKIVRQGDCIFVKPYPEFYQEEQKWSSVRHLTEKEYRELLVAES